jgi:hypothetical protein
MQLVDPHAIIRKLGEALEVDPSELVEGSQPLHLVSLCCITATWPGA